MYFCPFIPLHILSVANVLLDSSLQYHVILNMAPVLKILSLGESSLLNYSLRYLQNLDGGHGRGISGLQILQRLMEKIKDAQSLPEVPRPCELFDLIGGTGTGG